MCPCHFFQERREGDLRIGHLVVFLFHQCITFFNKCRVSVRVRVLTRPTGSSKYSAILHTKTSNKIYLLYVSYTTTDYVALLAIKLKLRFVTSNIILFAVI